MGTRYGRGSCYTVTVNGERAWQASKSLTVKDEFGQKKRKRITGTAETQREAWRRLEANLRDYYAQGEPVPRRRAEKPAEEELTFEQAFVQWHKALNPDRVSDVVRQKYRRLGEQHLVPYLGETACKNITRSMLEELMYETLPSLKKPGGEQLLSAGGRANIFKVLNMVLKRAMLEEYISRNPAENIQKPKYEAQHVEYAKIAGMSISLMKKTREARNPDYCRYLFQYLGMRQAERLGLEWSCIKGLNTKNATIEIRQQLARYANGDGWYIKRSTKTKAGMRRIPLVEPWLTALREHKKAQDEQKKAPEWEPKEQFKNLVFLQNNGTLINRNKDTADWHELLEGAGYPYWRAHLNRWTTASLLAEQVPPVPIAVVRQILGHGSEAMSYYYIRTSSTAMRGHLETFGEKLHRK